LQNNMLKYGGMPIALVTIMLCLMSCDRSVQQPSFQGYMEGELILIGPEEGGRISRLFVKQGEDVEKGHILFELNSTYERAQRQQAASVLKQAEAELRNLQSEQMRAPEISVLEARKRSAHAALELSREDLERKAQLYRRRVIAKAQLDVAQAAFDRDQAAFEAASREIDVAHLSARQQMVKAALAKVTAAEAALRQVDIRLDKRKIKSPQSGRIEEVNFRAGEVVTPGQPVIALLPPENIKVRFFVPEPDLSGLNIGTVVGISCDGCADNLKARIDFVAQNAEFTPPIIYGPKERAKLVFRVEARAVEKSLGLVPGQPVTVTPVVKEASK